MACDEKSLFGQIVHKGETLLAEFANRNLLHNKLYIYVQLNKVCSILMGPGFAGSGYVARCSAHRVRFEIAQRCVKSERAGVAGYL